MIIRRISEQREVEGSEKLWKIVKNSESEVVRIVRIVKIATVGQ